MWGMRKKLEIPTPEQSLPGRAMKMPVPAKHFVNGNALEGPYPAGLEMAVFGLGCFWGAERKFWEAPGVWTTAVGYAGGSTPNRPMRSLQRHDRPHPRSCWWSSTQADQL